MNHNYLTSLCLHFNLGAVQCNPQRIYGGLLHTMWRIQTTMGTYAIKQLCADIDLTNSSIVKNYNLTEEIAHQCIQQKIPALCAIKKGENYLYQIDNVGFLAYDWVEAKADDTGVINVQHALKITNVLAHMHALNISIPTMPTPTIHSNDNDTIATLAYAAQQNLLPFAHLLIEKLPTLLAINNRYKKAVEVLVYHTVISHGDLDQKNVLWDAVDNPILIDWESARRLNSTYEMINMALDWSGIITQLDRILFTNMIATYKKAGGLIDKNILQEAFYGVLGNWINWLVYNIQRSCKQENLEQQKIGTEQVTLTLPLILSLHKALPELIKLTVLALKN